MISFELLYLNPISMNLFKDGSDKKPIEKIYFYIISFKRRSSNATCADIVSSFGRFKDSNGISYVESYAPFNDSTATFSSSRSPEFLKKEIKKGFSNDIEAILYEVTP